MSTDQVCYTLVAKDPLASKKFNEKQIKTDLEGTNIVAKAAALKEVIRCMANGERIKDLLMTVIRFVMPCQDHLIKKLLLLFWEIVPKYGSDGQLLHEMILVCDSYRKDLQHPNEFIRGCTLRFLCKLKEPELLEPLIPAIKQCLEHRHAYVRRNAVLAIFTIYRNFDFLFPDAPNMILQYLESENDASCKRNAFIMLTQANQSMALEYLATCLDEVPDFDEILQLVIVELIYKVCHVNPTERARFIRCVYGLLQSKSPSVRYEAAGTLVTLSNAPTAIKSVASCYVELIMKESDNNVKLIVLDRLIALRGTNERIMQDIIMDIVPILSASDLELRSKTLELMLDLVTARTVVELTTLLLKELFRVCTSPSQQSSGTSSISSSEDAKYRFTLVHTIYESAMRFPNTLPSVIPVLCDVITFDEIGDSNASAEVCRFLRESIKRHGAAYQGLILVNLTRVFGNITGRETLRHILWIFGEFVQSKEEINSFMNLVRQSIGDLPLVDNEIRRLAIISGEIMETADAAGVHKAPALDLKSAPKITSDGTYATQTALNFGSNSIRNVLVQRPILQAALFDADFLPGVILAAALVKIFPRYQQIVRKENRELAPQMENVFAAECMLFLSSMIHLASKNNLLPHHVNPDLIDRIWKCFRLLLERNEKVLDNFNRICDERLDQMLTSMEVERRNAMADRRSGRNAQKLNMERERNRADAPVKFNLLSGNLGRSAGDQLLDMFDVTLSQALGGIQIGADGKPMGGDAYATSKLSRVHQLTGFSDPVYAEAYVNVNQFDIVLDILIVNQTDDTLQNLNLELSTIGDLKLVERPAPLTLAPTDFTNIKANIKVSSTENGMIFGNIVYDVRGSSGECTCVVLNEIHIDILEYITPATCTPTEYRQMWTEFEWENKVTVNTQIAHLHLYLEHILRSTNFKCLTPKEAMAGDCDYLCVTLYAKSVFGEHVLANLCLEKQGPQMPVTGHARIRAKTQGMAVTMGDKMSACQKKLPSSELLKEFEHRGGLVDLEATKSRNESVNGLAEEE